MRLRSAWVLLFVLLAAVGVAQPVQWVGNTKLYLTGVGQLPSKGAYVEKWHSVSVTTQTWPIAPGQTVTAVATFDNWQTTQEYVFSFDYNVGNNSQWFAVLGPFPPGSDVQFYIRANGQSSSTVYDNNGWQNFGVYSRFSPTFRREPILQWFETDYRTILKKLPEVVEAGYGAIYLPPPTKSGGGAYSVGYNPFDRFDLGDRLSLGTVRTKYGTAQELAELIEAAHRMGVEVYCDVVFNHNDNRASTAINRYPDLIPEDFHIKSSADTSNSEINFNNEGPFTFGMLNYDLIGLADLAHEDNNNTRTGTFTLPSYAQFNPTGKPAFVRHPRTPQYYPGGQPVAEDVREYLKRWSWYLSNVWGFDGFRLDAVKHTAPAFFDSASGQPGSPSTNGSALPYLYGVSPNAYVFAENFTSNAYELREYTKTGMNMLDFPLKFNLDNLFNSSGFGSLSQSLSNNYGLDGTTGLPYEKGGLGRDLSVAFVQSHDQGPPWSSNMAYAFALTRTGRAKVYYDGNNIEPGNYSLFPKPGRADALGAFGDTLTRLVDADYRFGRGDMVNRWTADHLYVYERQVNGAGVMLVGLNNRGDQVDMSAEVQTAFLPGTVLRDLSGQKPDLTVDALGKATIVVPSNTDANSANNARGYVVYAPKTPSASEPAKPVRLFDAVGGSELTFNAYGTPSGTYGQPGSYKAATVNTRRFNVLVQTDASGDNAWLKLDEGKPVAGLTPSQNTVEGLTDGFVPMTRTNTGRFELSEIDAGSLAEGMHVLRVRVFANTGNRPKVFSEFRAFVTVRRPAGGIRVDGDLTDLGNPVVTQARTPSSQGNRLDALYVTNDDRYLYVGLAGNVDPSEGLTNGISLFLDTDPGNGTGVRNFDLLNDDSGPATRLLSNAAVTAPSAFGAEFGLGVMRRTKLGSSADTDTVGDPVLPPSVGAFAGLYKLNASQPSWLERQFAAVGWLPRNSQNESAKGLEAAIPLSQLVSPTVGSGAGIGYLAYLGTTGESGQTLPSTDAQRGVYGGFGLATAYLTNQFLPVQPIQGDPGFSSVTLSSYVRVNLKFATAQPNVRVLQRSSEQLPTGIVRQTVLLTKGSAQTINGPITVRVTMDPSIELLNRTATSLRQPGKPYLTLEGVQLLGGGTLKVELQYRVPGGKTLAPTFEVFSGRGIL
ncbi:MAG: alpha-amylase family glycosyl hydrolase [Fimbriimonadales bacterium]